MLPYPTELPDGAKHARTTPVFTDSTTPAGITNAHRTAVGVWGQLRVTSGQVIFTFEDHPGEPITVPTNGTLVIPPQVPHHVSFDGPAEFVVEFYKVPDAPPSSEPGPQPVE